MENADVKMPPHGAGYSDWFPAKEMPPVRDGEYDLAIINHRRGIIMSGVYRVAYSGEGGWSNEIATTLAEAKSQDCAVFWRGADALAENSAMKTRTKILSASTAARRPKTSASPRVRVRILKEQRT